MPAARAQEKPKVSAFTSAKIDEILKLQPDFVGFSDIQVDIAAEPYAAAWRVDQQPPQRVEGIPDMRRSARWSARAIRRNAYGRTTGAGSRRDRTRSGDVAASARSIFEEWDEPPTGNPLVTELVRMAGGDDVFPERGWNRWRRRASRKTATKWSGGTPDIIPRRCGKKFRPEKVACGRAGRGPGGATANRIEVASPIILQPGPVDRRRAIA